MPIDWEKRVQQQEKEHACNHFYWIAEKSQLPVTALCGGCTSKVILHTEDPTPAGLYKGPRIPVGILESVGWPTDQLVFEYYPVSDVFRETTVAPAEPVVTEEYSVKVDWGLGEDVVVKGFEPEYFVLSDDGAVMDATLEEWGAFLETDKKIVKVTKEAGITVSTIFLGLPQGYDDGVPILWETQVFGGPFDGDQLHSASHPGALVNHHNMMLKAFS
jgi:hypothetical protein